jgi:HAD superfamily hydrolase (TIGR01509 family)
MVDRPSNAPAVGAGRFHAVIFDCDGVLVDSEVLVIEVLTDAYRRLGAAYDASRHCARFLGLEAGAIFAELEAEFAREHGHPLPAGFRDQCFANFRSAAAGRLRSIPGARRAVAALNLPVAVASSSDRASLVWKLETSGLLDLFGAHIYSREVAERTKPAPDIYLHVAAALELEPERCLVVEDSENGVRAARAAGMTVWGFRGGAHNRLASAPPLDSCGAELTLDQWSAFPRLLRTG